MTTCHTQSHWAMRGATMSLDLIQTLSNYPKEQKSRQGHSIKLYDPHSAPEYYFKLHDFTIQLYTLASECNQRDWQSLSPSIHLPSGSAHQKAASRWPVCRGWLRDSKRPPRAHRTSCPGKAQGQHRAASHRTCPACCPAWTRCWSRSRLSWCWRRHPAEGSPPESYKHGCGRGGGRDGQQGEGGGRKGMCAENNTLGEERGEQRRKNDWMGEEREEWESRRTQEWELWWREKKESAHERQMGRGVVLACCPTTQTLDMTHTVRTVCHCVFLVK